MNNHWNRRQFVQTAGSLAALGIAAPAKLRAATGYRVAIVVAPGGKMGLAMELIFTPLILQLMDRKRRAMAA